MGSIINLKLFGGHCIHVFSELPSNYMISQWILFPSCKIHTGKAMAVLVFQKWKHHEHSKTNEGDMMYHCQSTWIGCIAQNPTESLRTSNQPRVSAPPRCPPWNAGTRMWAMRQVGMGQPWTHFLLCPINVDFILWKWELKQHGDW